MAPGEAELAWRVSLGREIGLRLQRRRLVLGLSQEQVAHRAGIATFTYQKYEHGESRPGTPLNPTLFTLYALADVLNLRVEELIKRDGVEPG
ncbi:MAG: helix-turn-helix transcriptional regulator [Propionibacteriaceae bacterium]|jgi:transcriptional regulator with XRE-family HTH domain|nr:helix-turn-helix transcriptional regulator [Propionibacteriaceae bacterium]